MARRFLFLMLDGVGAGALPDAAAYGDAGSDTLGNLSRIVDLRLPFLEQMGLGNIIPIVGVPPVESPLCLPGRLAPLSAGKDSTVGHWEHMGLVTAEPFPTYPEGFPEEIIGPFVERIGRHVLGNKPASGTAIIAELGEEHLATGLPIVYTSTDSVFQIAAHVDVVPLETLYTWCRVARELLVGPRAMARVIARPFCGPVGAFARTKDRRDFSLDPTGPTYLDVLQARGVAVLALGKISEIFQGRGVSTQVKVASNEENLTLIIDLLRGRSRRATFTDGLLMTNLVDFDMVWGHRNDVDGFACGLEAVDAAMPWIIEALGDEDRLIITADHGVDPTTRGTDHTREYAPLLLYPRPEGTPKAVYEGMFADSGATVCAHLTDKVCGLKGADIRELRPHRGWKRYASFRPYGMGSAGGIPVRVGVEAAAESARWLEERLGQAPVAAVVLGSGLAAEMTDEGGADLPYSAIPNWESGSVEGHSHAIAIVKVSGSRIVCLRGRVHEYEGFDLGEAQLHVRTLAAWGVRKLIVTTASGAVDLDLSPGDVVTASQVLDLQYREADGRPAHLPTRAFRQAEKGSRLVGLLRDGVHASVPGPQYETPAELAVLRALGASTVSMSAAAEVRAALDEGLEVAVLAVVVNSGDTTHEEVLAGAARASEALIRTLEAIVDAWGAREG